MIDRNPNYEQHKARMRDRSAAFSRSGRDIGPIPEIVNPARRASCERDLERYMLTYFPHTFCLEFSDNHRQVIKAIQTFVLEGGCQAYAMPRGSGKTCIVEAATAWSVSFGHRFFCLLIGSTAEKGEELLFSVKGEFEDNELLMQDFPEICHPIAALEGINHRCRGQLCNGEQTKMVWADKEIVLPTIPGSKASGAIIRAGALLSAMRGQKVKLPDGRKVRPDLIIPDDPQTDESAMSPTQCAKRIRILKGAVSGLAGPGVKPAIFMPCTIIANGDLSDQMLNRDLNPAWHGVKTRMIEEMPTNMDLWDSYAEIRRQSLKLELGTEAENKFYAENRRKMDAGAKVTWEARKSEDELSALQHAMNIRINIGEEAFDAEYQNAPHKMQVDEVESFETEEFIQRLNRRDRGLVSPTTECLTAFVDIQQNALWWVVCGFSKGFDWDIVDYGTYPDQKRSDFTNASIKKTLLSVMPKGTSFEESLYDGLDKLTNYLCEKEWKEPDGTAHSLSLQLIDSKWGQHTKLVYKFCRQSKHKNIVVPSSGKYIGASSAPMGLWKGKDGDRRGDNWIWGKKKEHAGTRGVTYDTNYWKSFTLQRAKVGLGGAGAMTLFGTKPETHRMFARHLEAEKPIRTNAKGRVVDEWKHNPGRPDNHWWDCLVGCGVAASMSNCKLGVLKSEVKKKRRRTAGVSYMNL